jgi:hypothetical protein
MYLIAETEIERIWVAMFQNRDKAIKVVSNDIPKEVRQEVLSYETSLEGRAEATAKKFMEEDSCDHGNGLLGDCARCLGVVGFEFRTGDSRSTNVKNSKDDSLYEDEVQF